MDIDAAEALLSLSVSPVGLISETTSTPACSADHDYDEKPATEKDQLAAANEGIAQLEQQLASKQIERFGLERLANDEDKIQFYTGFHSYQCLKMFFQCIVPYAATMRTWSQVQRSSSTTQCRGFQGKLLLFDQMFLFLHKLRLGSLDQHLADKFAISQSTVSRYVITWVNFLYVVLGSQPIWPSKSMIQRFMPNSFKDLFPETHSLTHCCA